MPRLVVPGGPSVLPLAAEARSYGEAHRRSESWDFERCFFSVFGCRLAVFLVLSVAAGGPSVFPLAAEARPSEENAHPLEYEVSEVQDIPEVPKGVGVPVVSQWITGTGGGVP